MKIIRFLSDIVNHIINGRFSYAFYEIAQRCPSWLFRYNKAKIMLTESFRFPEKLNPDIRAKIADKSNVDDIVRISGIKADRIISMMDAGAICFISYTDNSTPTCVSWSANGPTFVRGMGFYYNLGPDGYYTFGAVTIPEARGKGHYLCVESEKIRYELKKGAKRFYALIEFTNKYSYSLFERLGYYPFLEIIYFKLLFLRFCLKGDLLANNRSLKIFVNEPSDNMIVI